MESDLPKVLMPVCDQPIVEYVLDALAEVGVDRVLVVVGYRADLVRQTLTHHKKLTFVEQTLSVLTSELLLCTGRQSKASKQTCGMRTYEALIYRRH